MRQASKRPGRKPSEFGGRPNELGGLLADLRAAKGLSLREVEEATGKAVSNAYLSQLENGRIKKPSPNVLHTLAAVYAVPYEALQETEKTAGTPEDKLRLVSVTLQPGEDLIVGNRLREILNSARIEHSQ